jgi:EAL domain-containing protein (putative c-di-GMP-specific phosphodiesterase class I)/FixJ family two-component response regulator
MMKNNKLKILVLDDEPFMLKMLSSILKNIGYTQVFACDNGPAALALINPDDAPDLILLDLNMPEMDGIEFVRHLVGRQYNGSLILISGEDERMQQAAEKLAQVHQITVLGRLPKPPSSDNLAKLIRRWSRPHQGLHPDAMKIYSADEVRAAISNGELVNYYQPKVEVATRRVVGVETLVRWRHPSDGIVPPDQFIAIAEANGLINDLTCVVLKSAFAQTRIWKNAGMMLHVAVNLSMDNLNSLNFLDTITGFAAEAEVPPQMIELEITESRLMGDLRIPLEILTRLRLKRFRLSIDDFGTGNSSLAQLRDLPFDELKIDRSFVHNACENEKLRTMFDSSLGLAKQLRMSVVAEGVEDQRDWTFLRKTGCDIAQGYFIARPMPAEDLPGWIKMWQSKHKE